MTDSSPDKSQKAEPKDKPQPQVPVAAIGAARAEKREAEKSAEEANTKLQGQPDIDAVIAAVTAEAMRAVETRVAPLQERGASISIRDVVAAAMKEENLKAPLLIRFQDILHHRVKMLNEAFAAAITEERYRGTYRGVFPIKVNQLREVVEEILEAGVKYHYGIEVGSKPEIFAALSVHTDNESLIVCNGYKDDAYIRTALLGRKLGKKVILIAEKLSEVRAICRVAKDLGVEPMIGLRVRLMTRGAGRWALNPPHSNLSPNSAAGLRSPTP